MLFSATMPESARLLLLGKYGYIPQIEQQRSGIPTEVMDVVSKACRGNYRYIDCIGEEQSLWSLEQLQVVCYQYWLRLLLVAASTHAGTCAATSAEGIPANSQHDTAVLRRVEWAGSPGYSSDTHRLFSAPKQHDLRLLGISAFSCKFQAPVSGSAVQPHHERDGC